MTLSKTLRALTLALSAACVALAVAAQTADLSEGEIRKVDKEGGKMTIAHGEIKSIDMPPMTMVFTVKNPVLFGDLKKGDKVRFAVVREDGKLVLTEIVPAAVR
ncbi:MAG: copper-binding protein [Rhodoferax sp.]|nr:copper-binding protein [Rhodoferax sp.]